MMRLDRSRGENQPRDPGAHATTATAAVGGQSGMGGRGGDRRGAGAPSAADDVDVDLPAARTSASTMDPSTMRLQRERPVCRSRSCYVALARVGQDLVAHGRAAQGDRLRAKDPRAEGLGDAVPVRRDTARARASPHRRRSTPRPAVGEPVAGAHELGRERVGLTQKDASVTARFSRWHGRAYSSCICASTRSACAGAELAERDQVAPAEEVVEGLLRLRRDIDILPPGAARGVAGQVHQLDLVGALEGGVGPVSRTTTP